MTSVYEEETLLDRVVVAVFFVAMFIMGVVMLPYYLAGGVKRKVMGRWK